MAKKIPIETKAEILKYYSIEKCSIVQLVKYASAQFEIEVTRQSIMKWIKNKLGFFIIIVEKSGLIEVYGAPDDELDIVNDDRETPSSSRQIENVFLELNLNKDP